VRSKPPLAPPEPPPLAAHLLHLIIVEMEPFGTAAGVLGIAGLFNNCVQCFEYIQLGRHFGQDYERCQLKLDTAKARLSRWGQAIDINHDPRFATDSPQDQNAVLIKSILEQVDLEFLSIQKASKRYALLAKPEELEVCRVEDMGSTSRRLHNHLSAMVKKRQKGTSVVKKAAWALYDAKKFENTVQQITGFVDDLEKLLQQLPNKEEQVCRQLAELEIEEIEDEPSLKVLADVTEDTDKILSEVIRDRLEVSEARNYVASIHAEDDFFIRVGDESTEQALSRPSLGVVRPTRNEAGTVTGKGRSRVHIGNSNGGPGIFNF
jgi:hypothetical protein